MTHPVITDVTRRLVERSAETRAAYLDRVHTAAAQGTARGRLGCANFAHGFAASGADKARAPARGQAERRDRVELQRHAVRPPALRRVPRTDQGRGPGRGRGRPVRGRRARHVRWHHPGPRGHGAVALQPRRHRHGHGDRPVARHVRRRADARRLRQDRAGARHRRTVLRPPAHAAGARRPDDLRPFQRAEEQGPPAVRRPARSAATSCSPPRPPPTTARGPARSTAPPTPTRC